MAYVYVAVDIFYILVGVAIGVATVGGWLFDPYLSLLVWAVGYILTNAALNVLDFFLGLFQDGDDKE